MLDVLDLATLPVSGALVVNDRPARASKLRSRAAWATLIFAAALGLRVGFILETQDRPGFRTPMPGMDTHVHWQAARALRGGATTDEPVFELMLPSAPLYVHWLAFWQRLLGDASITPHRVQHALLGSLNAVLVYLLVGSLLGPGARGREPIAVVVATIWAGLPSLIFFDTSLHKSALGLFLVLVLLLTLLRSRPRRAAEAPNTTTFEPHHQPRRQSVRSCQQD